MKVTRNNAGKFGHTVTRGLNSVFVFGGANEDNSNAIPRLTNLLFELNLINNECTEYESKQAPSARSFHSTVFYCNKLIVFGGKANGYRNDVHEYDIMAKSWRKINTLSNEYQPTPRYGHSVVVHNDSMFIFGGYDNGGYCSNDLHILDLLTGHWLPSQQISTIEPRFHHSAEVIEESGKMYIIGGCNNKRQAFDTVYEVDLTQYSIIECPSLPHARFGHTSYMANGKVNVFGGCDFSVDFPTGFVRELNGEWTHVEISPFETRSVFGRMIALEDELIAIGGVTKNEAVYAPPQNTEAIRKYEQYTEELGDSSLVILQFLPIHDLVSVILTSKNWSISQYAKHNVLWEEVYYSFIGRTGQFTHVYEYSPETFLQIIEQHAYNKYKSAIDMLYQGHKEYVAKSVSRTRKVIMDHAWRRDKNQPYGIPRFPIYRRKPEDYETGDVIKLIIVGDGWAGKTSMLFSYVHGQPLAYMPTTFDNYNITVNHYGKEVLLGLWDTAGPEDYDRLRPLSYPGTHVFLLVFSVVDPRSFTNVVAKWIPELRKYCYGTPILLCGSKIDLRSDRDVLKRLHDNGESVISREEGDFMAEQCGCIGYVENSAVTQEYLPETFFDAASCSFAWAKKRHPCKLQ